jgi:hypothetical protein
VNAIKWNRASSLAQSAPDAVCSEFFVTGFDEVGKHGRGPHTEIQADTGPRHAGKIAVHCKAARAPAMAANGPCGNSSGVCREKIR